MTEYKDLEDFEMKIPKENIKEEQNRMCEIVSSKDVCLYTPCNECIFSISNIEEYKVWRNTNT